MMKRIRHTRLSERLAGWLIDCSQPFFPPSSKTNWCCFHSEEFIINLYRKIGRNKQQEQRWVDEAWDMVESVLYTRIFHTQVYISWLPTEMVSVKPFCSLFLVEILKLGIFQCLHSVSIWPPLPSVTQTNSFSRALPFSPEDANQGRTVGKRLLVSGAELLVLIIIIPLQASWVAQTVKNLPCGRPGFDGWVGKIPWRGFFTLIIWWNILNFFKKKLLSVYT